ncbi:hypothetical protein Lste_3266 [Legionella steelei]|uniref:Uncharacterized protein n=1 Tax=Legionella steelei TaxID=947033 RepID=A0A0W0ZDD4_9GAMM|nr:hypothetical protein Lste_3266 [Legionella steelei]
MIIKGSLHFASIIKRRLGLTTQPSHDMGELEITEQFGQHSEIEPEPKQIAQWLLQIRPALKDDKYLQMYHF